MRRHITMPRVVQGTVTMAVLAAAAVASDVE
jgi:hypothetical protein